LCLQHFRSYLTSKAVNPNAAELGSPAGRFGLRPVTIFAKQIHHDQQQANTQKYRQALCAKSTYAAIRLRCAHASSCTTLAPLAEGSRLSIQAPQTASLIAALVPPFSRRRLFLKPKKAKQG